MSAAIRRAATALRIHMRRFGARCVYMPGIRPDLVWLSPDDLPDDLGDATAQRVVDIVRQRLRLPPEPIIIHDRLADECHGYDIDGNPLSPEERRAAGLPEVPADV